MVEPTQDKLDRGVRESMEMFQRSRVGEVAPVEPQRPRRILLATDGSSQDALGVALVRRLATRFAAAASVVDAREKVAGNELAVRTAAALRGSPLPKSPGADFEQILRGVEDSHCDLVAVPCPFGRDLESVGPDSVGTVIDVLLTRSPVPILVLRRPYDPPDEVFRRVLLVLTAENEAAPAAVAWAAAMVAPGGNLRMVLILQKEFQQNVQALLETIAPDVDVQPDALAGALAKTHVRLHRAIQKTAAAAGFRYDLDLRQEGQAADALPGDDDVEPLVVLALERADDASRGYVHKRIRLSSNSLLVVPRD